MTNGINDVSLLFKIKIMSRLNVVFRFVQFHDRITIFQEKWNINQIYCKMVNNEIKLTFLKRVFVRIKRML